MKKAGWMKTTACMALCAVMMTVFCAAALAVGSGVAYVGGADKFVFVPEDTDLFQAFKDVMPGDVLIQEIEVKNTSGKQVRVYLQAEPVEEQYAEFLAQLRLSVVQDGSKTIFEAAASEQDGLKDRVLLGTFKQNGSAKLTVTLSVPETLDNQYMDTEGHIHWVFSVEEVPESTTPKTGDNANLWLYGVGFGVALMVLAVLLVLRRKKKSHEEA